MNGVSWALVSQHRISAVVLRLPFPRARCTLPVDAACCPSRSALWVLVFIFMTLSSSSETSHLTWLWRMLGPHSRQRRLENCRQCRTFDSLQGCKAFQSESWLGRQSWLQRFTTVLGVNFDMTSDFQFSMTVLQFFNKFGSALVFRGIIEVDPFCGASRRKIHYCVRRSKRAKVEKYLCPERCYLVLHPNWSVNYVNAEQVRHCIL